MKFFGDYIITYYYSYIGVYVINTLDGLVIKKIKIYDTNYATIMLESFDKYYKALQMNADDVKIVGKVCRVFWKV